MHGVLMAISSNRTVALGFLDKLTKVANWKEIDSCAECFDAKFEQQDSCARLFAQGLAF